MILALLVHRPHVILAGLSQATAWLVSLAVICSRRAGSGHGPFPLHLRLLWHAQPAAAAVVAVPALWYWSVGPEIIPLLVSTAVELLCVAVLDWELVTSWQKDRSDAEEQLLHDDGMVIRVQRVKLPCYQVMKHFRFISNAFLHEKPCVNFNCAGRQQRCKTLHARDTKRQVQPCASSFSWTRPLSLRCECGRNLCCSGGRGSAKVGKPAGICLGDAADVTGFTEARGAGRYAGPASRAAAC